MELLSINDFSDPGKLRKRLSSARLITIGFAAVILAGALLLMLPIATRGPGHASFADTLFTSTSAVCVTGLIVQDTGTYWTAFGQAVIIALIQIGGLGVVTMAMSIFIVSGRRIGLMQRSFMQDSISAPQVGGIIRLTGFIIKGTVLIEGIGAAVMAPTFIREFGVGKGIWYAVFHSISAFCNAGFDLMGVHQKYSSITEFVSNPAISITIALLIIVGGIGFIVWNDVVKHKWHFKRYRLQSKVALTTTAFLIVIPTLYFFFFQAQALPKTEGAKWMAAFFQAVTPRTAGFNSVDLTRFNDTGVSILTILQLIGGSPGSTAGGMKTTTFAVMIAEALSVFAQSGNIHFFGRNIPEDTVRRAGAILMMYIILFLIGGFIISSVENIPITTCLFEAASAIGTVGLTLGITPHLSLISRTVLVLLMYFGRVGGLTIFFALSSGPKIYHSRLPKEDLTVG
ncbi:TrkH family potassium uptake protein [Pseudoramibacter porci]|uniref:Trk family potassium uptake protein n=1 Tax=Pseudoramibacter porci TaxID=2606631 RepID=A0A7X2NFM0_9FIRM|nr:potassium transporter TrkG [Pseudoramibacter porci]MSS19726.1 Trk family potassium uptake protein [Pseudoramibacter porci]